MFSKACEYGIKATTYIALQSLQNRRVSLKEIAAETDSPVAFTAKILQQLAKSDVLKSNRGPYGGFEIPRDRVKSIMLADVVFAIDGNTIYEGCALGFDECNADQPCPLHNKFIGLRDELSVMLKQTSLYDLAVELKKGVTYLRR